MSNKISLEMTQTMVCHDYGFKKIFYDIFRYLDVPYWESETVNQRRTERTITKGLYQNANKNTTKDCAT